MTEYKLHDNWRMCIQGTEEYIPAKVPGSVYQDLLLNGRMEDPFYRDNELEALKLMEHDFVYEAVFPVPEKVFKEEIILLHFDGIDTIADIWLNGTWLSCTENMHRVWEFDVKKLLKSQGNVLKVRLYSPTKFIRKAYESSPLEGSGDAMRGFPSIRKAHCMFGWDWGPRLPDAGIWRDVKLLAYHRARIDSVYVRQHHDSGRAGLELHITVDKAGEKQILRFPEDSEELKEFNFRVTLTGPDGETSSYDHGATEFRVNRPRLWWPNGYGDQPLYTVRVELWQQDGMLDAWEKRIGLRTMTVRRNKDAYGEQFAYEINGVKIFAMGGDYIPEDNILGRVTPERTYDLLTQARDAHFNCIRVWGGGYYPGNAFWDACDELGLIVWQDFMFACAVYDLTEEFERNVTAEFIDNIKRIRHHASLGLWCGNNEMEMFVAQGLWVAKPAQKSDYVKLFEYIIPKVLKEYDPDTFYWPASPSSGGAFDEPNDENRGDVHYWDVWHGNKPITEYRKFYFRYLSEFGFQSFPSLKTCESFTEPGDRNIFSYVMEKHQRNAAANGKIMNYMEQTFLYPTSFDTVLYASQLLQAEAIRYGVEHFRRNRGRCMGTVIWQLNDCWPVASWSSIDYYGRWKALHYYAKRFFAPLMLSCAEEGVLTQDTNPNAEPYEVRKSVRFCAANETMDWQEVTVKWALRNRDSSVVREKESQIRVAPLSSVWLDKEEMQDAPLNENYVSYELVKDGITVSSGTVIFCQPKYFKFPDPCLAVRVQDGELVVTSKAYARSVEIINEADDMLLDDNYFDMNAGERRVRILKGKPEGLKIRSVFDIR